MAEKQEKVKLSPPWDGHMSMLASFFAGDSRVKVGYCGGNSVGTIEVFDTKMYVALQQVMRQKVKLGNVTLKISIVPANGVKLYKDELTDLAALKEVLKGNPAFSKIKSEKGGMFDFVFCIFKPVVLQWYNDNLGNPWKLTTSTYEKQADFVFKRELGVSFTTEPPKGFKVPKRVGKAGR